MAIYKKINKYYLPALFFLVLSLFLIFVWFKEGHFYGGGDVGLPTYNPIRIFQIAKFIWWESIAPGFLIPHTITSISLYLFLSILQLLGIGPFGIQAILFFVLLFFMGFGMYLLALSILGQDKKRYAIIAGLFYMFNPYMMTQIWHRFVHTSFVFAASIPFLVLFWRLWIKSGNYLYLLYFLLTSLLASYMFGTIAFVFPLWLIMSLFTISEIFLPWENKSHLIKILWRSALGLAFWMLLNSWWIIPVFTVSQGVASQQHNAWESIQTLIDISKQAILPYSLQMGNSFYLFDQAELGEIYKSFFFRVIPWLGVIVIFYGMVYSLQKKYLAPYVLIYLVIIMLAKGISSPFGQPFLLLFSKSFAFGLLRNPFEKIGILLPLVSSILFALGIEGFFNWPHKILSKTGKKIILIIWLMTMGIYYWPMYQGTIFGRLGQPNYVEIPQSYKDANEWLNEKVHQELGIDGKILHLPLIRSDIATYKWKYGYHGVESSASLFTALPSISHGLNLHSVDDSLTALSMIFNKPYNLNQEKILKLLQDFNVRFIILHKDLDWLGGDTYNPLETEKLLNSLNFIKQEAQFGDLVIYKINDEFFSPKIELSNNISLIYPQKASIRLWPWLVSQKEKNFISPIKNDLDNNLKSSADETLIFPENSFSYPEALISNLEETKQKLVPLFPFQGKISEVEQRQFYDFMINDDGTYELLLTNSEIKDAYINDLAKASFQINNAIVTQTAREIDNVISFGKIDFKKGLNEISFIAPLSKNLIPSLDDLIKIGNVKIQDGIVEISVSKNSPSAVESPILHTVGEDVFQISFDAKIPANIGLYIQVIQDMDIEQNGQKVSRISFLQHFMQSDWQGLYNIQLPSMSLSTREAKVRLIALIPQELTSLNAVSTVTIKDLKLIRVLKDQIFLKGKTEKENLSLTYGQILKMKQKTPVLYEGKIKIGHPIFLIFKEAFHPGWELELKRNNEVYKVNNHYLANLYGNAWWIEKTGEYEFKIEFKPQQKVTLGIYLALAGLLGVGFLIVRSKMKKNL